MEIRLDVPGLCNTMDTYLTKLKTVTKELLAVTDDLMNKAKSLHFSLTSVIILLLCDIILFCGLVKIVYLKNG